MVEVVNRQRRLQINTLTWSAFATKALAAIGKSESWATIAFVSDRKIRELNKQFRGIDRATDVLSFPSDDDGQLGDIAISIQTAVRQAKANKLTVNGEISQLILHGLLHLAGYDHE